MKNNKGITLVSLITYVIGMTIVVALIATITSFFVKNMDASKLTSDTTQYTDFSSVFLEEINKEKNTVIECKPLTEKISYIIFSSGNQYTFNLDNKSIYKNNIKICDNVEECDFSYTFVDSKYKITVNFKTENIDMTQENAITYTM